jgi:hypothetical protein
LNQRDPWDILLEQALAADDAGAAPRNCPGPDELAAYLEQGLGPEARERLERHLAVCRSCRETASTATASEAEPRPSPAWVTRAAGLAGPSAPRPGSVSRQTPGLVARLRAWLSPPRLATGLGALLVLAVAVYSLGPEHGALKQDDVTGKKLAKREAAPPPDTSGARRPATRTPAPGPGLEKAPPPPSPAPGRTKSLPQDGARRPRSRTEFRHQAEAPVARAPLPAPVVHCPDYLLPLARRLPGLRSRGLGATDPALAASRLDSGIVLTDGALSGPPPAGWGAVRLGAYPLAVAAHPRLGVKELSLEQLRRVYLGKLGNWRELGGGDTPIQPLAPAPDSYAGRLWSALVLGGAAYGEGVTIVGSRAGLGQALSERPGAVGYLPLGALASSLRALAVGGALPGDHGYPLAGRPTLWFTADRRDQAAGLARRWSGRPR